MKASKICIAVGAFIICTALICNSNRPNAYKKKMYFSDPKEIIEVLNNNPISSFKEGTGELVYSDKFLECLSYRKRIVGSNLYISDYDLHINEDKENDEYKNKIISNYKTMLDNFKDYTKSESIKAYNLVGTAKDLDGKYVSENLDVIFIEEGEGWVIDYIIINAEPDPSKNYDRS